MNVSDAEFKEVNFEMFCQICKHRELGAVKDPCDECLEVGMREGTFVPLNFEEEEDDVIQETQSESTEEENSSEEMV